jgi:N-acetylglutamate synthase-like GNAT family acetyltransferase
MTDPPRLVWYLRRATRSDAGALTALAHEAKASWGYPKSWIDAWSAQLTVTADYIDHHRVTVACRAYDILGMCAIEDHEDHWMLEHVWVSPMAQRRGVGRFLVVDAASAAQRVHAAPVRLLADPFAQDFYGRLGARVTGWVAAPMDGDPGRQLPLMEL